MKMLCFQVGMPLAAVLLALFAFLSVAPRASLRPGTLRRTAFPANFRCAPKKADEPAPDQKTIGGELAHETRESAGEDQEENANLKHAAPVQWLARQTGLSVHHGTCWRSGSTSPSLSSVVFWVARKYVPGMMRNRSAVIQQALEEARAASREANRRLADVEYRLHQLDVEIGQMQASAEKESNAEELRIEKAAAEDIRKVVAAAEQEIAAAAKQARRELTSHTAGLAIALARKQIDIQPNTDQVLVRTFASKLTSPGSPQNSDGGKDGE